MMQTQVPSAARFERATVITGLWGGLGGGLAFALWGILAALVFDPLVQIHTTPILLQIAGIVHSTSSAVGLVVHLVISALLGVAFVFGLVWWPRWQRSILLSSMLYGAVWWVLGTLTLLPMLDGMSPRWPEALLPANLFALIGHVIYGLMLGLIVQARLTAARSTRT